jgi:hypothetical protein
MAMYINNQHAAIVNLSNWGINDEIDKNHLSIPYISYVIAIEVSEISKLQSIYCY